MDRLIYLDHSATTQVSEKVLNAMLPFFREKYGNPSSIYTIGRESRKAVEEAREKAAAAIGATPREIFFTGSGTEADNWAIRGLAIAKKNKGNHIITSVFEHHAVLHVCNQLEREGFKVTYVPVDGRGLVDPEQIKAAITDQTILVTVMTANNEIGTIQPIREIGAICKARGIAFHTDAVQAVGNIPVNVDEMNVDMLTLTAHKFYGPKGAGALYIRKGTPTGQYMYGGAQERNRRAGTENVAGIVGLGVAIEDAVKDLDQTAQKLIKLRDRTIKEVFEKIPNVRLNGDPKIRLPGNCNFSFEFIEGESLLLMLDMKGIAASSGSACTSGSLDPSHVLLAIGLPHEIAHGSLRITYGRDNTDADVDTLLQTLPGIVTRLREMSPLYVCKN